MRNHSERFARVPNCVPVVIALAISTFLLTSPLMHVATAQNTKSAATGQGTRKNAIANRSPLQNAPGAALITAETEPNDTTASATPLGTTPVRVRGDLYRAPFSAGVDVDVYSFFGTAGDRVYAATMTNLSGGSRDTVLEIIAPDGDIIEVDDDDGQVSEGASNVAGTVLTDTGTHYVRVRQFNTTSLEGTIRPYDLYVHVHSGVLTAETEPNNYDGTTPPPLAPTGWMSGAITPAGDTDTYLLHANAGDTIVAILDVDPELTAAGQNIGAPGPEGLSSTIQRNGVIKASLIDPMAASSVSPNRVPSAAGANPTNAAYGTLDIRRRFTNHSSITVTRLRFRIVDITAGTAASGTADLRALSSTQVTGVMVTGGGTVTVEGTTLEEPPAQTVSGGGLNSTLLAGTVSLGDPLTQGESVNLQFLLGVQQPGSYRFFVNVEAGPPPAGALPASRQSKRQVKEGVGKRLPGNR